ncbi:MAG: hypothetical protein SPL05_04495 [Eubacteriales bacterium]|nr:hypothetical protein [Eubacteriales bacterium]
MSNFDYQGEQKFRPITAWGYVGYTLLFAIPVVGWLLLIVFASDSSHINRRSFARSYFCWIVTGLIIFAIVIILGGASYFYNANSILREINKIKP